MAHEVGPTVNRFAEFRALARNRSYAALWFGQSISWVGNSFSRISLLFLLMEGVPASRRHLPLLFLMLVHAIAYLVVGPFAGVFVDRWSRKTTMIVADLVRAGLVLLIPFVSGHLSLYVLSFLMTVAALFFEPARHSALPDVVGTDHLFLANSALSTSESCAELVGLLAGGVLVSSLGYRFAFYFDSLTFLISAVAIAFIAVAPAPAAGRRPVREEAAMVLGELRQGLGYVRQRVDLRALFGLYFLMAAALGSINYLLPDFAKTGLGRGPEAYALLSGGIVAGYVMGSVIVALGGKGNNRITMVGVGLLGMGLGTVAMAAGRNLPLAVASMFIGGLFNPVYYVASRTYIQEVVPNQVLGRVFSLQSLVVQLGFVASVGLAAVLVPQVGLRTWLLSCGAALAVVGWTAPRFGTLGRLRRGEQVARA